MAANGNAAGLMQIKPAARQDTGLSEEDKFDPQKNAMAGAAYLKKMYALFPDKDKDRTLHALEAYEWGPAHADDISAGRVPAQYVASAQKAMNYGAQYANTPYDQFASRANTEALNLSASRDARENAGNLLGQGPGDAMATFSSTVVQGTAAVENFVRSLIDGAQAIRFSSMGAQANGGFSPMDPSGGGYMFQPLAGMPAPARP
jgi:hypothetical protein